MTQVLARAPELVPESPWLASLTQWDALRFVRAALNEKRGEEGDVVLEHAMDRLSKTATWRMERKVDEILTIAANRETLAMPNFFYRYKATTGPIAEEACWLSGCDAKGRPVALFQADRHTPGEIDLALWEQFVIYNAESTIAERGVATGPNGQFSLIVDRSSSALRNQDPKLAISVLPTLTAHYPELLGSVYVAPVNRLFYAVWAVVRVFLAEETKRKFILVRGADWRERLANAVGGNCEIPKHMCTPSGNGK